MQYKLIIFTLIISILLHLGIVILFGKVEIDLSYFDFIDAYIIKRDDSVKKKNTIKEPPPEHNKNKEEEIQKNEKDEKIQEHSEKYAEKNTEKLNETPEKFSEKSDEKTNILNYHDRFSKFINEKMKFDVYWMGIYAGSAYVLVKGDSESIKIYSEVNSAAFISNFYYVHDKAESIIEKGKPKYFRLIQSEGKHRGDKEVKFDYDAGEITFINNIKNKISVHKGIDKIFMDVLSGFFYLRTFQIDKSKSIFVDIFDSDKFATVEVKILREEKIETSDGKEVSTLLVKPELTTEGLFKRKGDIFIWISNDERKIPLKIETKVPVGKITAELKEYKKE